MESPSEEERRTRAIAVDPDETILTAFPFKPHNSLLEFLKGEPKVLGAVQILLSLITVCLGFILAFNFIFFSKMLPLIVLTGYPFWGATIFFLAGFATMFNDKARQILRHGVVTMNVVNTLAALIGIALILVSFRQPHKFCQMPASLDGTCGVGRALLLGILSVLLFIAIAEFSISVTIISFRSWTSPREAVFFFPSEVAQNAEQPAPEENNTLRFEFQGKSSTDNIAQDIKTVFLGGYAFFKLRVSRNPSAPKTIPQKSDKGTSSAQVPNEQETIPPLSPEVETKVNVSPPSVTPKPLGNISSQEKSRTNSLNDEDLASIVDQPSIVHQPADMQTKLLVFENPPLRILKTPSSNNFLHLSEDNLSTQTLLTTLSTQVLQSKPPSFHISPSDDLTSEDLPSEDIPSQENPSQDTPSQDTPSQDTQYEDTLIEDIPSRGTPYQQLSFQEILTGKTPPQGTPSQKPPSQGTPSKKTPSEGSPYQELSFHEILTEKTPSQGSPYQQLSFQDILTEKTPSQVTPSQKTPSQGTPSKKTPSEGSPYQELSFQDILTEKTPSQGTPPQKTPSQGTPSQRTPSEGSPYQQLSFQDILTEKTPSQVTPSQKTPSQGTPSKKTPSEGSPYQELSFHEIPTEKIPSQGTPSQKTPSQGTPFQRTPSEGSPYQQLSFQDILTEKAPSQETPSQKTPSQGTPFQRTLSEGSPYQELSFHEILTEKTPSQGTPSQGTPSQGTPFQRTPSEGSPYQQLSFQDILTKKTPSQGTPPQKTSSQGTPSKKTPSEGSPYQELSFHEILTEKIPSQETLSQETPYENALTQDTPSEETLSQDSPYQDKPFQKSPSQNMQYQDILSQGKISQGIQTEYIVPQDTPFSDLQTLNTQDQIQKYPEIFYRDIRTEVIELTQEWKSTADKKAPRKLSLSLPGKPAQLHQKRHSLDLQTKGEKPRRLSLELQSKTRRKSIDQQIKSWLFPKKHTKEKQDAHTQTTQQLPPHQADDQQVKEKEISVEESQDEQIKEQKSEEDLIPEEQLNDREDEHQQSDIEQPTKEEEVQVQPAEDQQPQEQKEPRTEFPNESQSLVRRVPKQLCEEMDSQNFQIAKGSSSYWSTASWQPLCQGCQDWRSQGWRNKEWKAQEWQFKMQPSLNWESQELLERESLRQRALYQDIQPRTTIIRQTHDRQLQNFIFQVGLCQPNDQQDSESAVSRENTHTHNVQARKREPEDTEDTCQKPKDQQSEDMRPENHPASCQSLVPYICLTSLSNIASEQEVQDSTPSSQSSKDLNATSSSCYQRDQQQSDDSD
ncbi:membrane-spanning 4-domains subfamily A member 14 [Meriones unguiculatus]|uniref:membrane-spanning 4-domains subfamily A member 14 n=1 Tax=Meriones unguiculatus TaxID=10047 RepID=UPI00293E5AD3|nr:membrane-spanning 4-domains subfamily A member 14 [Meriones unguiculatus]